jgi:signal transduction histidine kinase
LIPEFGNRLPLEEKNLLPIKRSKWRGFSLQLFFIIVLPLTAILLLVVFGSQELHHEAMRSLVGDRDLKTVRAAADSLQREVVHLTNSIQILSRSVHGESDLNALILEPGEISSIFDGGIALYTTDGHLIQSTTTLVDWQSIPNQLPEFFQMDQGSNPQVMISPLISSDKSDIAYIFSRAVTGHNEILLGAFSPDRLIGETIGSLVSSGESTVMVISAANRDGKEDVLYHGGPVKSDERLPTHPGIQEVLAGESGINYFQSIEGEHVVAFSPIPQTGWGLIIEEAWEDIASPSLINTQFAPLVIVPVFLLALLVIGFGARSIVNPLQKLEKQAARLAEGDFEAIRQPVGGIEDIRNLQLELMDMAEKLKTAQQNLHGYIGAITAGVENERLNLARELHDDTIQMLIALHQRIQLVQMDLLDEQKKGITELQSLVQQAMVNLRRMIRGLRPIYLEDLGLVASLKMLVHEMQQSSSLPISFTSNGLEYRLDVQSEISIYRIVQESLNNVIHHADAKHAWVTLEFSVTSLLVQIGDDGKGFMIPSNPYEFPAHGHFGLVGLYERAELIHAELGFVSKIGDGTTITLRLANTSV